MINSPAWDGRPKDNPAVTITPEPSKALVRDVRAGFIRQGSTFTAWCRENGLRPGNARQALLGSWDGPKGQALRRRIVRAAAIEQRA